MSLATATRDGANEFVTLSTFRKVYEEQDLLQKSASHAYSSLKNWDDAEDIASEVYNRISNSILNGTCQIMLSDNIGSYVFRAAANACVDLVRRRQRSDRWNSLSESGANGTSAMARTTQNDDYAKLDAAIVVRQILDQLPEKWAEAITCSDLMSCTAKEAAAQLGLTTPAFKSRLYRGRSRFRELLLGQAR